MRTSRLAAALAGIAAIAAFALTGCGSSSTTHEASSAAPTTSAASAATSTVTATKCALQTKRDLIIWEKWPGQPDSATRVGDVDIVNCVPTLDHWQDSEPKGAGHCSKIAWSDDNPGYDVDQRPVAPLKSVLDQTGPAC